MTFVRKHRHFLPGVFAATLLVACSGTSDTSASPTEPPATSPATAADLVLRADGIGPLTFGDPADASIATLTGALGDPSSDTSTTYSTPSGGYFESADGSTFFIQPAGREVCFSAPQLCAFFGGSSADDLTFVGWLVGGEGVADPEAPSVRLSTADGVTVGSTLAELAAVMSIDETGCYAYGYGNTADMFIRYIATTGEFIAPSFIDPASTEVFESPSPEVIAVERLSSGERPYANGGDCPG